MHHVLLKLVAGVRVYKAESQKPDHATASTGKSQ